ncbi:MAG: hypothetical protein WBC20_09520 [Candidatus Aminicenantaceae bacterium]
MRQAIRSTLNLIGSLPFCVGNNHKVFVNGLAPLQIFHAIPSSVYSTHKRRTVGGKNRLKAERAWFLSGMERGAKPETEQLLTRWGKSCVFSESTVLSLNILAARLYRVSSKSDSGRLNLQRSLHPSQNIYQDMFYPHKMEEIYRFMCLN